MKVLIVDDHALFREGLRFQLEDLGQDIEIFEAGNFDEALRLAEALDTLDLAIVDLAMPGMSWREGLSHLCERFEDLRITVLSASPDVADVETALELGAAGFIPKDVSGKVLLGALRLILDGGTYIPPTVIPLLHQAVASNLAERSQSAVEPIDTSRIRLTPRQKEILPLLAKGLSNKEIARKLGISEGTVKLHVSAVIKVLNARNRTEAVVAAFRISGAGR